MVANPDKFQCIMLSRNGGVSIPLSVHNNILYPTEEIKVLGEHWTTAWTLNLTLLTYVIVPLGKLIHLKGLQNTWRLIDDYQYTKVLSKAISHTVHWLGSFVEGRIAISLKNYRNVPFALFLMTFQRVMKFCAKGLTLCLFHSIVFVSWA